MSHNFDLDQLIKSLPAGLDRALLRVLSFHRGRGNAIGRYDLVDALKMHGFNVSERAMRAQIGQLRKAEYTICSAPGENGGYYMATSPEEYEEFEHTEYLAKITDMQETLSAMRRGAKKQWGEISPARQGSLF